MGKMKQGINGPFTGRVGSVVGISYDGLDIMRSIPKRRSRPFTAGEIQHQARFRLIGQFLKPIIPLLNQTFKPVEIRHSGYNKAFAYNLKNSITGLHPNLSIDYSMLLLGRGDLPNAGSPSATSSMDSKIVFSWTDNSGKGKALPTDKAYVIAYCEEFGQWIYEVGIAVRSAASFILDASKAVGKTMQTYIGFISDDGKEVSDSIYTGLIKIR